VAGDNHAIGVDKDRIGEPKFVDRGDDLVYLSFRMGARVARVRDSVSMITAIRGSSP
jgi:hypothetical protein